MTKEDPFDEKAALLELEQLRESIQAARQARQRKSAEFDAFVKGFRKPASTPESERSVPTPLPSQAQPPAFDLVTPPLHSADPLPSTVAAPPSSEASGDSAEPTRVQGSPRHRSNMRPLGVGAIIAVVALGLLSTRWRKPTPPPAATNPVTTNQVSTARGKTPTGAAPQAAAAAQTAARGVVVELKTVRAVWIRVVVDGQKNVEGMIQGGEPLHLTGDHSIVVRVGNGGDVLVKTGEREEPFGVVGQPVTRTFSKR